MKKILLFARDPGAANVVVPLAEKLEKRGYEVKLFGKDAALSQYIRMGRVGTDISLSVPRIDMEECLKFLASEAPAFLITGTGSDDFSEKYLWKAAENLSIPSFAILDHWFNYGVRFSPYRLVDLTDYERDRRHPFLPSKILVMDDSVRADMARDGFDTDRLAVVGQPYFEYFREQAKHIGTVEMKLYRERMPLAPDEKLIAFFSENITEPEKGDDLSRYYWGYTERSVFCELLAVLKNIVSRAGQKVCVVVKPHPNETIDAFSSLIEEPASSVRVLIDREVSPTLLSKAANLVCGMSSMVLVEAAILGLPVMSIQIGLSREDPFILSKRGITRSILSRDLLQERLEDFFAGRRMETVTFEMPEGATERIICLMEEFL